MIDIETMVEPPAAEPLKPIFTPVDKVAEFPHSDELPEGCQVFDIDTDDFFSDAMNTKMSTMHTTMNAAPMFMDFQGLVIPVITLNAANAYGGMKEPTELPKNA